MSVLSHITLGTNDMQRAAPFYDALLGALGFLPRCLVRQVLGLDCLARNRRTLFQAQFVQSGLFRSRIR